MASFAHSDPSGGRDVVYCHHCTNQWLHDEQRPLRCDRCGGEAVEIITPDTTSDPRLPAFQPFFSLGSRHMNPPDTHDPFTAGDAYFMRNTYPTQADLGHQSHQGPVDPTGFDAELQRRFFQMLQSDHTPSDDPAQRPRMPTPPLNSPPYQASSGSGSGSGSRSNSGRTPLATRSSTFVFGYPRTGPERTLFESLFSSLAGVASSRSSDNQAADNSNNNNPHTTSSNDHNANGAPPLTNTLGGNHVRTFTRNIGGTSATVTIAAGPAFNRTIRDPSLRQTGALTGTPTGATTPQPNLSFIDLIRSVVNAMPSPQTGQAHDGGGSSNTQGTQATGAQGAGEDEMPLPINLQALLSSLFEDPPDTAVHGDAVYSQEALDRIVSMLMEQNTQSNAAPPASQAALHRLEIKKVDDAMLGSEGRTECTICIDELHKGDEVTVLPCGHWFHGECVVMWLKAHNTCPVCRASIEAPGEGSGGQGQNPNNRGGGHDPDNPGPGRSGGRDNQNDHDRQGSRDVSGSGNRNTHRSTYNFTFQYPRSQINSPHSQQQQSRSTESRRNPASAPSENNDNIRSGSNSRAPRLPPRPSSRSDCATDSQSNSLASNGGENNSSGGRSFLRDLRRMTRSLTGSSLLGGGGSGGTDSGSDRRRY